MSPHLSLLGNQWLTVEVSVIWLLTRRDHVTFAIAKATKVRKATSDSSSPPWADNITTSAAVGIAQRIDPRKGWLPS